MVKEVVRDLLWPVLFSVCIGGVTVRPLWCGSSLMLLGRYPEDTKTAYKRYRPLIAFSGLGAPSPYPPRNKWV